MTQTTVSNGKACWNFHLGDLPYPSSRLQLLPALLKIQNWCTFAASLLIKWHFYFTVANCMSSRNVGTAQIGCRHLVALLESSGRHGVLGCKSGQACQLLQAKVFFFETKFQIVVLTERLHRCVPQGHKVEYDTFPGQVSLQPEWVFEIPRCFPKVKTRERRLKKASLSPSDVPTWFETQGERTSGQTGSGASLKPLYESQRTSPDYSGCFTDNQIEFKRSIWGEMVIAEF